MKSGQAVGKIARRLGVAPTKKTLKVLARRPVAPGEHGAKRRGARSVYGIQLLEKQKLRFQFMVSEKTLRRAFTKAKKAKGRVGENLLVRLDSRLDATIFRSGVVASIPSARQLISHHHVLVNGRRVQTPSFKVNPSDVISFTDRAKSFAFLREGIEEALAVPYITVDKEQSIIVRTNSPSRSEIPVECDEQLVVEFYSR